MNFRMIEVNGKFWFGGGADLTPFYPNEEDFSYFHGVWKKAAGDDYPAMKKRVMSTLLTNIATVKCVVLEESFLIT